MSLKKKLKLKKLVNNNKNKSLLMIRKKIDKIDNKIHDLIMERAELVSDVVKEKRKESSINVAIYRPQRENEILLRLIKRHKGSISVTSLILIWRHLISTYISIQGELKIIFSGNIDNLVNSHFMSEIKKIKSNNSIGCLKSVSDNKSHIAILPFPNKDNDWWSKLENYKGLNIIGGISNSLYGKTLALIVSKQNIEYAQNNIALYTLKINTGNMTVFSKFISSKGYNLISKKLLSSKKYLILFSIKISSELEKNTKLKIIESFEMDNNLKPKYVGVFSAIDKGVINEQV